MDGMSDDAETQLAAALSGIPLEQAALQAKRRRAQALMGVPTPQGQQIGRVYKAASPLEHLATALSRGLGARQDRKIDEESQGLAQRAQQEYAAQARQKEAMRQQDIARQQGNADRDFGLRSSADARAAASQSSAAELANAQAMAREADAARDAQHQADSLAETRRSHQASEANARQDTWGAVPDPVTGGIVMYNRRTGEYRALGPGGGKPGTGGGLPAPKPKDLENDVQSLGKDLEPVNTMRPDAEALEKAAGTGNVAGFGPVAGRVPNLLASGPAVANRQAAGRLMAGLIKETSGAAAAEAEVERLLEANGMGRTATDEQIATGVANLQAKLNNLVKQREAKYHPEVVETYKRRGGTTSGSGAIRVRRKSDGKTGSMPSSGFNPDLYEKIE
jgi:hypothetical protein